ncbi:hypothetical protein F4824DRAFT_445859 [Ustulina deusta]|nr:hypothetical protein F4824DRAFT_445859 [Ustulina deusta]
MNEGTQSHIHTPNRHLNQLHNFHLPALGWIGFCSRGMAFDHRLTNPSTYGPSESVGAFYDFLVALALVSLSRSWLPSISSVFQTTMTSCSRMLACLRRTCRRDHGRYYRDYRLGDDMLLARMVGV